MKLVSWNIYLIGFFNLKRGEFKIIGKFKNKIINGMIKEYRLLDFLGSGGNCVVYRAEADGNFFVIKFLNKKEMGNIQ